MLAVLLEAETTLPTGPVAIVVLVASLVLTAGWVWYLFR